MNVKRKKEVNRKGNKRKEIEIFDKDHAYEIMD
jgi:hypothetical protein